MAVKQEVKERLEQELAVRMQMRSNMEAEHQTSNLPEKARDLIWDKAWEYGHASGEHEVAAHYAQFSDIAKAVLPPPLNPDDEIDVGGRKGKAKADFIAGYKDGRAKEFGANAGSAASPDYMAGFGSAR